MILFIFLIVIIFFLIAYFGYGSFVEKKLGLPSGKKTPAHELYDNHDYCPTKPIVLFGHHFSSIAGAGPIVGPVIAGILFGWLPALLWIVLGSIFLGGVHDFSSLAASIKNKGKSVAELAKQLLGTTAYKTLLVFIWLSLVYVLIVFLDLTADTFAKDSSVASASIIYIGLAIIFGISLTKIRLKVSIASIIFVPLVFATVIVSKFLPVSVPGWIMNDPKRTWNIILIVYMFTASVLPVWLLLQPRDYLSSFLLYAAVLSGIIGILFGGFKIQYPAFTGFVAKNQPLFPILFVTIACGAISGFHSLVASGTTSKQIDKEQDAKIIGYGGMLTEGIVAFIALATVMMLSVNNIKAEPAGIFASGIGHFLNILGIPQKTGQSLGLLILSSFILTTLDTATRISRYVFQELFNLDIHSTRFVVTFISILFPLIFSFIVIKDPSGNIIPAYKIIWPVFGASNQLLAAIVLLVISVWLINEKKNALFTLIPMIFMLAVTLSALVILIKSYKFSVPGITAGILVILALYLVFISFKILIKNLKK